MATDDIRTTTESPQTTNTVIPDDGLQNPQLLPTTEKKVTDDSPNARSRAITTAMGENTHGIPNQHALNNVAYSVGIHDDRGQRRTMEDAYSFIVDFARVRGQGYFAIFDGHAGKHAAEWCGNHFHEQLLNELVKHPDLPIPDVLNHTFHAVDISIGELASQNEKMHSGCTAVTAFLRLEDAQGKQSFLGDESINALLSETPERDGEPPYPTPKSSSKTSPSGSPRSSSPTSGHSKKRSLILQKGSDVVSAIKSIASSSSSNQVDPEPEPEHSSPLRSEAIIPPPGLRRVLYTANAGDARAVLCRGGKAVRLTYDHKGTDKQEAQRIINAGGFVMSGRVNGVLAVTRSLGDSSMKDFVVGSPYTTETELGDDDEFLILACDGLWDAATDQKAVDLVRNIMDPQEASRQLVEYALQESTDNITVLVVRFPSNATK